MPCNAGKDRRTGRRGIYPSVFDHKDIFTAPFTHITHGVQPDPFHISICNGLHLDQLGIHIVGATTDLKQKIDSMEINRVPVEIVKPGDDVGIKVKDRVREHDVVYKVPEE